MKKRKLQHFLAAALALVFVGCSNEAVTDVIPGGDDNNNSKDVVYMNVTVQLPTGNGTRSTTDDNGGSSDGTEVGQDYENTVKKVLVILAEYDETNGVSGSNDNKFIGYTYTDTENALVSTTGTVKSTQAISRTVLANYYKKHAQGTSTDGNYTLKTNKDIIRVYAFCNPTTKLAKYIENYTDKDGINWFDNIASISEGEPSSRETTEDGNEIWGGDKNAGGFLMSVAKIAETKKRIPKTLNAWNNYTSISSAFDFSGKNGAASSDEEIDNSVPSSAISVERAVARFDFKDGSKGENTYDVVTGKTGTEDDAQNKTLVQIKLTKMALVNMSKEFYYLRRVSDNGLNDNSKLCGTETKTNYVVDTDATDKSAADLDKFVYTNHFNYCLGTGYGSNWKLDANARNKWYVESIDKVLEDSKDNSYHIWRYVTENTIPTDQVHRLQRNGITTGIVFKGKLIVTNDGAQTSLKQITDDKISGDAEKDPILYAYGNELYVTWKEVRAVALNGDDNFFKEAVFGKNYKDGDNDYLAIEGEGQNAVYSIDDTSADYWWGRWQDKKVYNSLTDEERETAKNKFKKAATEALFTIYQSSKESETEKGYYCYYYYWNRHNDNNNPGVMGPMEFAVVRNNVYKLAVTNINKLGHPRIPENDPDPIDPEDPDEEDEVRLSVSVEVLPWVVRINNIEF